MNYSRDTLFAFPLEGTIRAYQQSPVVVNTVRAARGISINREPGANDSLFLCLGHPLMLIVLPLLHSSFVLKSFTMRDGQARKKGRVPWLKR